MLRLCLWLTTWLLRLAPFVSDAAETLFGLNHPVSVAVDDLWMRVLDWHTAETECLRRRAVRQEEGR